MAKKRVGIRNGALFNQTSTLWNNLVAYYTGDDTPNDSVGSNHASLFNGTTYGDGVINKGFQFDGINDYVDLPTNTFKPNGDFTVSCWLKDITSTSGWFIQIGDWTINTGFVLYFSGGIMRFTFGTNPGYYITSGPSLKSGLNHYVFSYTNGETKIYENGVLFSTGNPSPSQIPIYPQECPVRFGSRSNNLSNLLQGTLDEVGFWDRVLSESEVTELYNGGNGKQYTPPVVSTPSIITDGLVLNLDAGNTLSYPGTGTDWFDLTSNNNDGVLVNGVSYLTDNGGVMSFDSINDYVSITNSPDLDLPINTTLEFWVKPSALNNNDLITHRFNCYGMGYNPTFTNGYVTSKFSVYFVIGGWKSVSTTTTPLINSWYHIVGTYDGSTMKIYLNGVLENTRSVVGNITQNEADLGIGSYIGAPGTYSFDGEIPIGRIYHKTLTDSEVLQNYNATKGRFGL